MRRSLLTVALETTTLRAVRAATTSQTRERMEKFTTKERDVLQAASAVFKVNSALRRESRTSGQQLPTNSINSKLKPGPTFIVVGALLLATEPMFAP
ncbi:hypothetical protein K0M31_015397 [Melipona bicolor]|uniref:Uncharacterized protein n=1 Tax=Melipona bicolor TaxID=60889 RepID=A0AA40FFV4_9HYME|nr:hypothetical protein K0M31_015397 [Melipona bicolor]